MKIKVLSGCRAGGVSLEEGQIYEAPGDISERDAKALVRMRRAEETQKEAPKEETKTKTKGGKGK